MKKIFLGLLLVVSMLVVPNVSAATYNLTMDSSADWTTTVASPTFTTFSGRSVLELNSADEGYFNVTENFTSGANFNLETVVYMVGADSGQALMGFLDSSRVGPSETGYVCDIYEAPLNTYNTRITRCSAGSCAWGTLASSTSAWVDDAWIKMRFTKRDGLIRCEIMSEDETTTYVNISGTDGSPLTGMGLLYLGNGDSGGNANFDSIIFDDATAPGNSAPTIDNYTPTNLTPSTNLTTNVSFFINASDIDLDSLSYEWYVNGSAQSNNAATFEFDSSTGVGSYNITGVVNDSLLTDSQSWTLTVVNDTTIPPITSPYTSNIYENYTSSSLSNDTSAVGFKINTSLTGVTVYGVEMLDGVNCTRVNIYNGTDRTLLANGTNKTGSFLYLTSGYLLEQNVNYIIACDNSGNTYEFNRGDAAENTYPDDNNAHIVYVSGFEFSGTPTSIFGGNFNNILTDIAIPTNPPYTDNLTFYYKFDGDYTDSQGVYNITNNGTTFNTTSYVLGQSINLNGSSFVQVDYKPIFEPTEDLSISFWFKTTTLTQDISFISNYIESGIVDDRFWIGYADATDTFNVYIQDNVGTFTLSPSATSYQDNMWHNFVLTRDVSNSQYYLYLDGALAINDTNTLSNNITLNVNNFNIGTRYYLTSYSDFVNGLMDEVGIWEGKALNSSEVFDLYNNGNAATPYSASYINPSLPNTAPTIDSFTPTNVTPRLYSSQAQTFTLTASDPENDLLSYEWYINGSAQSNNASSLVDESFSPGSFNVTGTVTDGEFTDSQEWIVDVYFLPTVLSLNYHNYETQYNHTVNQYNESLNLTYTVMDLEGYADSNYSLYWKNADTEELTLIESKIVSTVIYTPLDINYVAAFPSVNGNYTIQLFVDGETSTNGFFDADNRVYTYVALINNAPTIDSYTPTNVTPRIYNTANQTFTITTSDSNNDSLSYEWYINGSAQSINDTTFTTSSLSVGSYNITAVVSDGSLTDSQEWSLTVSVYPNTAPTIDSFTPTNLTPEIYNTQNQTFTITTSDADNDSMSYEWYINGSAQSINDTTFTTSSLSNGAYNITATVTDGSLTDSQEWTLSVINEPAFAPVINSYTPIDLTPSIYNTQSQFFTIAATDANNDSLSYEWYINGTPQSNNLSTFTAVGSTLGVGVYNITAVVSDGSLTDSQEWTLDISYEPPTISSVTLTPTTLLSDSTPTGSCTATGITNLDYTYRWYRNGVIVANGTETNLTSGTELTNQYGLSLNVGENWTFSCYVIDDNGLSAGFTNSTTRQVQPNTAPTVTPTIDTPVYDVDDSLNARCLVSDVNGDNSTLDWKLYKNNVVQVQGTENNVVTGTNILLQTVTAEQLFIGDEWIISCNATDGEDASGWINSSTATILEDARPPVISSVTLGPEIALENYTNLTSTGVASDPNGGTINLSFTLYNNDVQVEQQNTTISSGATANIEWVYSGFSANDDMYVNLYAYDDTGKNDTENSSNLIARALNTAPVVASVRTSPASFIDNADNIVGYCKGTDAEGDTLHYNYKWYVDNVVVKSGSKSGFYTQNVEQNVNTLSNTLTSPGETVIFSCSVNDLLNESSYVNATSQLIYSVGDEAPTISSIQIVPTGTQDTTVDFNVSITGADGDGDNIRYEWRFVKNGVFQSITTSSYYNESTTNKVGILNHTLTSANDNWYVRARAYDGVNYGAWTLSNTVVISNTAPVMQSASIPTNPLENTTLESLCTASDADAQSVTFEYKWYKDGVQTLTTENVINTATTAGEDWIVSCRAYDGIDYSNWLNSSAATIIDTVTAPTLGSVAISGLNIDGGFTGTCTVNDIEGDLINYSYKFYQNGIVYSSGSINGQTTGVQQSTNITPTITATDVWKFECQGTDIDGSSVLTNSTNLTVPTISLSYNVETITATTILTNFVTNADSIKVYRDGVLRTQTTLSSYLTEGLVPETQYEFKLVPVLDSFTGEGVLFNVTTIATDNNAPIMSTVRFSPTTLYTNGTLTGYCKATDVDSIKTLYTYDWRVNNVSTKTGVTSLYDQGVEVNIGTFSDSNFVRGDNVSLYCTASDGIFDSNTLTTNATVLDTEPVLENILVTINETFYQCNYDYSDDDGDALNNVSYKWFKNNVEVSTNSTYLITSTTTDDNLLCEITAENDYFTLSQNSSQFTVGDFVAPTLNIITVPTSAYTDSAELIEVTCEDAKSGVALGYPKISYLNPNSEFEEVSLFYDGNFTYSRYNLFDIVGDYTEVAITCEDGNGNFVTTITNETITAIDRETAINVGGGGSSSGGDTPTVSFTVNPEIETVTLRPGSTSLEEFEVVNTGETDIRFTTAVLRTDDFETFDWISFDNGAKTGIFDINLVGGLSNDNKFVRYQVSIPADTPNGNYLGLIEVNANEITEQLRIEIVVDDAAGITFFDFLSIPLFNIPGTGTITGNVVAGQETIEGQIPFTVGWLILTMLGISLLSYGYIRLRRRVNG